MKVGSNYKQKSNFFCLGLLNIRDGSSVKTKCILYLGLLKIEMVDGLFR